MVERVGDLEEAAEPSPRTIFKRLAIAAAICGFAVLGCRWYLSSLSENAVDLSLQTLRRSYEGKGELAMALPCFDELAQTAPSPESYIVRGSYQGFPFSRHRVAILLEDGGNWHLVEMELKDGRVRNCWVSAEFAAPDGTEQATRRTW